MAAFIALLARDGAPLGPDKAARLGELMRPYGAVCGPQAGAGWCAAGASHAASRPIALRSGADGIHLAGWARIDDRAATIAALPPGEREAATADASNAALLSAAYRHWGEACLERLIGEFSFVLWDSAERRLLAATDQFGSRPLYHAEAGPMLIVSDSLPAIRDSGWIDTAIDEAALVDLMAMVHALDERATIHRAIRRLPPAHRLVTADGSVSSRAYWPSPEPVDLTLMKSPDAYAEAFRELLFQAVADRLPPSGPIAALMSGGMDSTAVTAVAAKILGPDAARERLKAHTTVCREFPESEGEFAEIAARALGIGLRTYTLEDYTRRPLPTAKASVPPEPVYIMELSSYSDVVAATVAAGGTTLTGLGGDLHFAPNGARMEDVVRAAGWRAPGAVLAHRWVLGEFPPLALGAILRRRYRTKAQTLPVWIDPSLAERTEASERHSVMVQREHRGPLDLSLSFWATMLASGASSNTGRAMEALNPFFDVRLVEFCRRLPAPQRRNKTILRAAMRGDLPDEVLARPKTALGQYQEVDRAHPAVKARSRAVVEAAPDNYVDKATLLRCIDNPTRSYSSALISTERVLWWLSAR